ncbi:unnamed protein product [Vitrella brassicaformis CCMP3155]|uniref:Uncharacterized protein n=1 Tax=Vitrella brassicaformis (strain CCMP3155) TaxID=1169540 RepID=A0A0G4GQN7_VITBC|nr:unnamed protein product [Vitrella brassicaformis CCMP3155]|eukprot:CEM32771.1 unnamed protein product [Vitrella brassicaformis CCMP3155]
MVRYQLESPSKEERQGRGSRRLIMPSTFFGSVCRPSFETMKPTVGRPQGCGCSDPQRCTHGHADPLQLCLPVDRESRLVSVLWADFDLPKARRRIERREPRHGLEGVKTLIDQRISSFDDTTALQVAHYLHCFLMLNLSQPTRLHVRRNATDTDAMGTERRIDMAKAFADLYVVGDFISIWVATNVLCLRLCGHQVIDPLSYQSRKVVALWAWKGVHQTSPASDSWLNLFPSAGGHSGRDVTRTFPVSWSTMNLSSRIALPPSHKATLATFSTATSPCTASLPQNHPQHPLHIHAQQADKKASPLPAGHKRGLGWIRPRYAVSALRQLSSVAAHNYRLGTDLID